MSGSDEDMFVTWACVHVLEVQQGIALNQRRLPFSR